MQSSCKLARQGVKAYAACSLYVTGLLTNVLFTTSYVVMWCRKTLILQSGGAEEDLKVAHHLHCMIVALIIFLLKYRSVPIKVTAVMCVLE
jgi:hypothetical protein